jgi:hypothetical protein
MHARSLYLDTSVIGGYFDPEFMADTRALWRLREAGRFRFVTSVLVDQETVRAPKPVWELMRTTFAPADVLSMTAEALELAAHYLRKKWCRLGTPTMPGMSLSARWPASNTL